MEIREVNFWYWLVGKLPKKLVYFCAMHVLAVATTTKYSNAEVGGVSGMDAIKLYGDENGI